MKRYGRRQAFTLVELMVVIAIIGILMSLLLPAVQSVRESGRRTQCSNNLKQFGLALQNYHDVNGQFPAGYLRSNYAFWTSAILPYIEQDNRYNNLDFNSPSEWSDPARENMLALQAHYDLFQCPSAINNNPVKHYIPDRVPSNYLACASGTVARESGPPGQPQLNQPHQNGLMFDGSATTMASVTDGTVCTVAVGEAVNFMRHSGTDYWGIPQYVDHWPIGSPSFGSNEVSEVLGSTGPRINSVFDDSPSVYVEDRELCFASYHNGGAQVVMADGHVDFVSETIDIPIWCSLGTRDNGEITLVD